MERAPDTNPEPAFEIIELEDNDYIGVPTRVLSADVFRRGMEDYISPLLCECQFPFQRPASPFN